MKPHVPSGARRRDRFLAEIDTRRGGASFISWSNRFIRRAKALLIGRVQGAGKLAIRPEVLRSSCSSRVDPTRAAPCSVVSTDPRAFKLPNSSAFVPFPGEWVSSVSLESVFNVKPERSWLGDNIFSKSNLEKLCSRPRALPFYS